ncbi:MAG: hypothetical protein JSV88_00975 [Candidatus Aminicenantes bacterium]|nr:MAG: hypothetical protein JSV88_00975 [Candidatus Aminicenantes bacterium]
MNADEIVKRNHDIHLHTWDFSDGWHTIEELVQYALRWMKTKPWLGVSDHTPLIDRMIKPVSANDS